MAKVKVEVITIYLSLSEAKFLKTFLGTFSSKETLERVGNKYKSSDDPTGVIYKSLSNALGEL